LGYLYAVSERGEISDLVSKRADRFVRNEGALRYVLTDPVVVPPEDRRYVFYPRGFNAENNERADDAERHYRDDGEDDSPLAGCRVGPPF